MFMGLRLWIFSYTAVLYLGFLNLSLFIIWLFGGTISCCWESVVYNVSFLLGFILSFNIFLFPTSIADCMAQFGFGRSWIQSCSSELQATGIGILGFV